MSRKSYSTNGKAVLEWRLGMARAWNNKCLTEEKDEGHPKTWKRDELNEILVELLNEESRDSAKANSYFKKISLASWRLQNARLDMMAVEKGIAYVWRRDGQIPAGMLAHYCRIASGFSVPVFDMMRIAGLEKFGESELINAVGADAALQAIIMSRIAAYRLFDIPEERNHFLGALYRLEQQIAEKLETPVDELYSPLIGKLLPSPETDEESEPVLA